MLHAPMFMLIVNMSLQMLYSIIMAHMPSAYGLGKNSIFNKVQFSSNNLNHNNSNYQLPQILTALLHVDWINIVYLMALLSIMPM